MTHQTERARFTRIMGSQLLTQLAEAAGIDPNHVVRIVLDVTFDDVVRVYAMTLGTSKLLTIDFTNALRDSDSNIIELRDGQ